MSDGKETSGNEFIENIEEDLDTLGERQGYITDISHLENGHGGHYKVAKDGKTVLIPQPSDDPNDPLNWNWWKKHALLIAVSYTSLLADAGSATGAVTLIPQAEVWDLPETTVNHSAVGNVFMLGAGGIVATMLAAYFGRYPVVFWFMIMATWTAAWCTAATTFEQFMAARILNGFFSTVNTGIGMMFIKDIFYFHEHARKINIWAGFMVTSPYFGPLFTAFIINTQPWQWAFGVYTIASGLGLLSVVFFLDETYYDRRIPASEQPNRGSHFGRMLGVPQWRSRHLRNTFVGACMRVVKAFTRPTVFISFFYYCFTFCWVVGINTTIAQFLGPVYGFGILQIGYIYFAPLIATVVGETIGHWLHDLIAKAYIARHKGVFEAEARLYALIFAVPFKVAGLIVIGYTLSLKWHWIALCLGWGLYVVGIMTTTTAISAYNLDSYPEASGELSAIVNMARLLGGFIVSYFMVDWANAMGTINMYATMAAIVAGSFILLAMPLLIYGHKLRAWASPLEFRTN